jgi:hypothetical protein
MEEMQATGSYILLRKGARVLVWKKAFENDKRKKIRKEKVEAIMGHFMMLK